MTHVPDWLIGQLAESDDSRVSAALEADPRVTGSRTGCRAQIVREIVLRRRSNAAKAVGQQIGDAISVEHKCIVEYIGGGGFYVHVFGLDSRADELLDRDEGGR